MDLKKKRKREGGTTHDRSAGRVDDSVFNALAGGEVDPPLKKKKKKKKKDKERVSEIDDIFGF